MHRPTILLFFTSFIYTATAVVKYNCNDPGAINYNNCGRDDSYACLIGCASNCGDPPQSYAGQAAAMKGKGIRMQFVQMNQQESPSNAMQRSDLPFHIHASILEPNT
ncbi:hypothetical protein CERZMDRAFT_89005 [Cercospora zeae-maydis SCOH1-5]|uniref:Uncharacterized protein n=1 Tax=Cercospora zeae-maydis SCOH1-5 TaxID=717836 RepID=A0A6A6F0F3_9PEZI|nr:hypothetical protein CERZMDRAFT_89005 [Cercospora zeae-maydis SCOH1-5]